MFVRFTKKKLNETSSVMAPLRSNYEYSKQTRIVHKSTISIATVKADQSSRDTQWPTITASAAIDTGSRLYLSANDSNAPRESLVPSGQV
jgi:hypothetical protein